MTVPNDQINCLFKKLTDYYLKKQVFHIIMIGNLKKKPEISARVKENSGDNSTVKIPLSWKIYSSLNAYAFGTMEEQQASPLRRLYWSYFASEVITVAALGDWTKSFNSISLLSLALTLDAAARVLHYIAFYYKASPKEPLLVGVVGMSREKFYENRTKKTSPE